MATQRHTYQDENGITRWTTNSRVPFDDHLQELGLTDKELRRCQYARERETAAFLAEYQEAEKGRKLTAEETYELKAAFGPGATVVNIITGRRIKT